MKSLIQFIKENYDPDSTPLYHGSPTGDLRGGISGLHLGTKHAATEALTARIGWPVTGEWDGKRKYGKVKLAGLKTLRKRGIHPTGYNVYAPYEDYYAHEHPEGFPKLHGNDSVSPDHKPEIKKYKIIGKMTNTIHTPHDDFKANGYMKAALKKGNAKKGYYYKNVAEDVGSISAVVPSKEHILKLD